MEDVEVLKKRLPQDTDIERKLLGCILLNFQAMIDVMPILSVEDFYDRRYRAVYEIMERLYKRNVDFDINILRSELKSSELEELHGDEFLMQIYAEATSSFFAKSYSEIIKNKSILRRLIKHCEEIQMSAYTSKDEVSVIIEDAEKRIFQLLQNKNTNDFMDMYSVMIEVLSQVEKNAENTSAITGVPTGFRDLDYRTLGLQKSDLVLIAARPSMGKTAFCLNLAGAASKANVPTLIFSLEMSTDQLGTRFLSMESTVESGKIRRGKLENDEWEKLVNASEELSKRKIYIDDTGSIGISEMRAKCRRAKLDKDIGLVVIDYLQLMSGNGRDNRQQEISEISRGLKLLAKDLDVPVIALSQLSRACESRQDHRPMLSDLRDSGAIEQDADIVMFLYRDDYYHPDTEEPGVAEIIIAKQRQGAVGTVKLGWSGEKTTFYDLETGI